MSDDYHYSIDKSAASVSVNTIYFAKKIALKELDIALNKLPIPKSIKSTILLPENIS